MDPTEALRMREDLIWLPKLMSAVLIQACRDIQDTTIAKKEKDSRVGGIYSEARAWFLGKGHGPFDFRPVCEVAGVDWRKVLLKMAPYLCPSLAHQREKYVPNQWRFVMRDCKPPRPEGNPRRRCPETGRWAN